MIKVLFTLQRKTTTLKKQIMSSIIVRIFHFETYTPLFEINISPGAIVRDLRAQIENQLLKEEVCNVPVWNTWYLEIALGNCGVKKRVEISVEDEDLLITSLGIADYSSILLDGPMICDINDAAKAVAALNVQARKDVVRQEARTAEIMTLIHNQSACLERLFNLHQNIAQGQKQQLDFLRSISEKQTQNESQIKAIAEQHNTVLRLLHIVSESQLQSEKNVKELLSERKVSTTPTTSRQGASAVNTTQTLASQQCLKRHPLSTRNVGTARFFCDDCKCRSAEQEASLRCTECDYDRCVACCAKTAQFICPSSHRLSRFVVPLTGFGCDVCHKALLCGQVVASCRNCDFDVCFSCVLQKK